MLHIFKADWQHWAVHRIPNLLSILFWVGFCYIRTLPVCSFCPPPVDCEVNTFLGVLNAPSIFRKDIIFFWHCSRRIIFLIYQLAHTLNLIYFMETWPKHWTIHKNVTSPGVVCNFQSRRGSGKSRGHRPPSAEHSRPVPWSGERWILWCARLILS